MVLQNDFGILLAQALAASGRYGEGLAGRLRTALNQRRRFGNESRSCCWRFHGTIQGYTTSIEGTLTGLGGKKGSLSTSSILAPGIICWAMFPELDWYEYLSSAT
jgi:hypothetical protein